MFLKHTFESPGFIVGAGRSGTTLIAAILNRHPEIHVTMETHFFSYAGKVGLWETIQKDWPRSACTFLNQLIEHRGLPITARSVLENLGRSGCTKKELFCALGETLSAGSQKQSWIEKTPNHIFHLEEIRSIFPSSPIIQIVRDGRDVALSQMGMPWASKSFIENLMHWAEALDEGVRLLDDPCAITVRFEDLVIKPKEVVESICIFLNINYCESLLMPNGSERTLIMKEEIWKKGIFNHIDDSQANKWKRELANPYNLLANMVASDWLNRYGYEVISNYSNMRPEVRIRRELLHTQYLPWDYIASKLVEAGYCIRTCKEESSFRFIPKNSRAWIIGDLDLLLALNCDKDGSFIKNVLNVVCLFYHVWCAKNHGVIIIWIPGKPKFISWRMGKVINSLMWVFSTCTYINDESLEIFNLIKKIRSKYTTDPAQLVSSITST